MKKCELIDWIADQKLNADKLTAFLNALTLAQQNDDMYLLNAEYALMGCSDISEKISKELGVLVELIVDTPHD